MADIFLNSLPNFYQLLGCGLIFFGIIVAIQFNKTIKDDDLEKFSSFNWNTKNIINIIDENRVKEVYFTKLGLADQINVKENTFEFQIRLIENYCSKNNI